MDEFAALRAAVEGHEPLFEALEARLSGLVARAEQANLLEEAMQSRGDELAAANARFDQVRAHVDGLIARYRQALVAGLPEAARALVTGATAEELERSAEAVQATIRAVTAEARAQATNAAAAQVPTGAPPRSALDISALSPREKIAFGLAVEK